MGRELCVRDFILPLQEELISKLGAQNGTFSAL